MSATTRPEWPTQLRLPGQAAAPEGPVPMHPMYVMHHAFRRDLTAFATAARETPSADRATWKALAERWALFAHILHHHHTGEDTGVWPFLMRRADAAGRETLAAMEAEHGEIDPLLEDSAAGFDRLAQGDDEETRAALAARLVAARESLGRHLAHEETEAIPLIQRHMTPEEWRRIDEEYFKQGLSLRRLATLVPWAAHGLTAAARQEAFAEAGKPFEVLWWLSRGRFEQRERRAFRYVTAG
jgi:hemerythrin-like domain-containing protein